MSQVVSQGQPELQIDRQIALARRICEYGPIKLSHKL